MTDRPSFDQQPGNGPHPATGTSVRGDSPWAAGGAIFAGVLMLVHGVLFVLQGIAAIAKDEVYVRLDDYLYMINLTGWGWILLILGILSVFIGWGILSGAVWARATGIMLAALSLVAQFLFLPYAPVWSVVMMAIDVFVIWALAVYHPATADAKA